MAMARDFTRATLLKRKAQAKRNREALEEERRRQAALGGRKRQAPPANKALAAPLCFEDKASPPAPAPEFPSLDSVPFASSAALTRAEGAGLTGLDFQGLEPSGKTGFTAGDVAGILEGRG